MNVFIEKRLMHNDLGVLISWVPIFKSLITRSSDSRLNILNMTKIHEKFHI